MSKQKKIEPPKEANLSGMSLRIWHEVISLIGDNVKEIDYYDIAKYCNEESLYWKCTHDLEEMGTSLIYSDSGYPQNHPYVNQRNSHLSNAIKIGDKYGLSPLSRSKIKKAVDTKMKKIQDPFAQAK